MSVVSSVTNRAVSASLHAVKNTVQGALRGDMDAIGKVVIVAGMATNAITVPMGVAALAGDSTIGAIIDAFA